MRFETSHIAGRFLLQKNDFLSFKMILGAFLEHQLPADVTGAGAQFN
jgi:hypothetical protein